MTYPTPNHEGFFWAKLVTPSKMPPTEDWKSIDWEVVEVIENYIGEDDGDGKKWGVFVGGVRPMQWLPDFIWGPEIHKPSELA